MLREIRACGQPFQDQLVMLLEHSVQCLLNRGSQKFCFCVYDGGIALFKIYYNPEWITGLWSSATAMSI